MIKNMTDNQKLRL